MKLKGKKLIFISEIMRDGSGTKDMRNVYLPNLKKEKFKINKLSISEGTYIAHGFNSYVVKLKPKKDE